MIDPLNELFEKFPKIESALGYSFENKQLLAMAFVHRSFVNEYRHILFHNERLEFLGDSILGMVVAEYLYFKYPEKSEGELSTMRSKLVEASSCTTYIQKIQIDEHILLGKGERYNDGKGRQTILADLFEAIIGAIFIDGGLKAARDFHLRNFEKDMEEILSSPQSNWKAILQDYCQKKFQETPTYTVKQASGPEHNKTFEVNVHIKGKNIGEGKGSSKKEAQQAAAFDALQHHFPGEL